MTQGSETARAGTNFGAYLRALSRFLFNSFTFTGGVLIVSIVVFLLDCSLTHRAIKRLLAKTIESFP